MDKIVKRVNHKETLRRMNDIRLFLRVSRLSNITNCEGNRLKEEALYGILKNDTDLEWPFRRQPLLENMKTWRNILRSIFGAYKGLWPKNLGSFLPPEAQYKYNFSNLSNFINDLPPHYKSVFGSFAPNYEDYKDILKWMQQGVLYAGSDGSVEDKIGAHAFCFTNGIKKDCIIAGAAPTPGNKDEMTSLRAELAGALCILIILYAMQQISGEKFRTVSIWIDNEEVLRRVQTPAIAPYWNAAMALDFDLWQELLCWQRRLKIPIAWEKVDSHVEEKGRVSNKEPKGNPLAWRLNSAADDMAGKERNKILNLMTNVFSPESKIMVECKGKMIYGKVADKIVEEIHGPQLVNYLLTKNNWEMKTFNLIDWDAMEA